MMKDGLLNIGASGVGGEYQENPIIGMVCSGWSESKSIRNNGRCT